MRMLSVLSAVFLASGPAATAWSADLTRIDRTIVKEPLYNSKPRYCLLAFGPEARTRIWLVQDGEVLYVDKNGNGDLTEKEERYAGTKIPEGIKWHIGDIVEADGKTRHTDLRVWFQSNSFFVFLRTAEGVHQEVGNEFDPLRFSDTAKDAPIIHLAGPLTFLLGNPPELTSGKEGHFIALIGTAGLGKGAATYSHIEDFGKLKMVVEVEFASQASNLPVRIRGVQTDY